jgi:quercetin dioxygenase-like cupin family protein
MKQPEFKDVFICKKWGKEFLYYENSQVAVWYLYIKQGESTSLHSHPKKKSALVVLDGLADFYFLSSNQHLYPFDKVMIRPSVFHRTKAVTDLRLLEFESPVDKYDLVRLQDSYGRAGTGYESQEHYKPLHQINEPYEKFVQGIDRFKGIQGIDLLQYDFRHVAILDGQLYNDVATVLGPGDVVSRGSFEKLVSCFQSTELEAWLFH